jgi:ankyrin repeat protein
MDYFDNTVLHVVAAKGLGFKMIRSLIADGANIRAKNTSGESFMHVMHHEMLNDISRYIQLLRLLAAQHFPFRHHDFHGRTLAHVFFKAVNHTKVSIGALEEIFSYLKPNLDELDNQGNSFHPGISDYVDNLTHQPQRRERLRAMLASHRKPVHRETTYRTLFWKDNRCGDSALITFVKHWPEEDELEMASTIKKLIEAGAEVHMRDRNGDTALAIAARRGIRPAVVALLSFGANVNSRSYNGTGILSQATQQLELAKKHEEGSRYAMILSCIALLTDHGAKEKPTVYDEWMSLTALSKDYRPPSVI